mmetsp:Transcript_30859/g.73544  ORF Transcript_30859/g.73544 Transcript_30859/m.73544 type:complete len:217 (-) Transcript_30859:415-1065(-)
MAIRFASSAARLVNVAMVLNLAASVMYRPEPDMALAASSCRCCARIFSSSDSCCGCRFRSPRRELRRLLSTPPCPRCLLWLCVSTMRVSHLSMPSHRVIGSFASGTRLYMARTLVTFCTASFWSRVTAVATALSRLPGTLAFCCKVIQTALSILRKGRSRTCTSNGRISVPQSSHVCAMASGFARWTISRHEHIIAISLSNSLCCCISMLWWRCCW